MKSLKYKGPDVNDLWKAACVTTYSSMSSWTTEKKRLIEGLWEDLHSGKYSEPMFEEGFKLTVHIQQGIAILSGM